MITRANIVVNPRSNYYRKKGIMENVITLKRVDISICANQGFCQKRNENTQHLGGGFSCRRAQSAHCHKNEAE